MTKKGIKQEKLQILRRLTTVKKPDDEFKIQTLNQRTNALILRFRDENHHTLSLYVRNS
jgi:hypothetical protein